MSNIEKSLLEINAVKFNTQNYFTWTSGIKSPIYTDNRIIMSHVKQRTIIYNELVQSIINNFKEVEYVVGTAVAGISPCMYIAEKLNIPMAFVRSEAKKHGTQKQIEGEIKPNSKVVIVEDLVSTGKSLKIVIDALIEANVEIIGIVSIFTYNLNKANDLFASYNLKYISLSNIEKLLKYSLETGKMNEQSVKLVKKFREQLNAK